MSHPTVCLDPADGAPSGVATLRAWLTLHDAYAFHPREAGELLREQGGIGAALRRARLPPLAGRALRARRAALARCGVRLLPRLSPAYPEPLAALDDAPCALFVRGDPAALSATCVAVVGARAATVYGRAQARRLGAELAEAGFAVVSGLARGVDAAAHEGALAAGGCTIAVLACGPDRIYPLEHADLAARVAAAGAVVTELPLGTPPLPHHFPARNRLISGLSRAVIVVEARARSGSLVTAGHAADQGREVLAVPGRVDAPTSAGPHKLLRDGAWPLLDVDDVHRALGLARAPDPAPRPEPADLSPLARRVRQALARAPARRDELIRALACDSGALDAALVELELLGAVEECRDGRLHPRR